MFNRILQFVSFLIVSMGFGLLVTIITGNLENIVEEKKLRHAIKLEVKNAVSAFKESSPDAAPAQTINFLKKFTASVMKDKVIAVDPAKEKRLNRDEFMHLFTFTEGRETIDIYIRNAYIKGELYDMDFPELFEGIFATIIVFTGLIFYAEKKRQALAMQQQFETRHAELTKAMEEHEALALLGRMTATLAHELKTPIATISNLIHVLPSRTSDENFVERFVVLAKEELSRTRQLIDNLLIYGKKISIDNEEWMGFKTFIGDISEKAGLKIFSCPEFDIHADGFYMRLLFENLLRNSRQAGADGISIKINMPLSKETPLADIFYEDNGSGFPTDCNLEELISPFITQRSRGAGLGLFLAQKIALAHSGSISLYRPKKGAGVRVSLPHERIRPND